MRHSYFGHIVCSSAAWLLLAFHSATAADFMLRTRVDGQMLEGKPLAWSAKQIVLLGRDGRVHEFNPKLATEAERTASQFVGYSASDMKAALYQEFGKRGFDISMTQHYLVVHPRGQRDQWADRFEQLYRRFEHYFRVRGFRLREPPYPLVAIVFRSEAEYFQYAEASGSPRTPGTLGHYDHISNRIFLFDVTADGRGRDWSENAETIIHEATHQTAYNVGIHNRFAFPPRWLAEGLAMMFEARGVWNPQYDRSQADRINRGRLRDFHHFVATKRPTEMLPEFLSSDQLFRTDRGAAYAEAWALSFYLCETQPRLYATYLAKTAERPLFRDYPPAERMADFQSVFGREMRMFEIKYLRYMAEVK